MTTLKLVGVAVLCGVFTGVRGGLFSVAMWRLNVRIRTTLFNSLLTQEIGFFDTQQTGGALEGMDGMNAGMHVYGLVDAVQLAFCLCCSASSGADLGRKAG